MSKEVIEQLKSLRHNAVNPRADWTAKNRTLLLSQIKNTISSEPRLHWTERAWAALSIFLPRPVVYNFVRPIAALVVVAIVVTTAYSGTVKASSETLPGDTLYPAKLLAEKIPVTVASIMGDKNTEVKLHVQIAKNRMEDAKKILNSSDPRKKDQMGVTVNNLKNELKTVNQKLDASKDNESSIKANAAKDVKQDAEQIKKDLQDVKLNLLVDADQTNKVLNKEIAEVTELSKQTSINAMEVMVTKHLEGDQSVSKEEVKTAINVTIQTTLTEVAESKLTIDGAKTIVDTINTEVKDLSGKKVSTALMLDSASTTKELAAKISDAVSEAKEAVVKADAVSAEVDKKTKEAQVLLGTDDLLKAMDKVKEAAEASKEAEKISDATIEKTQNVVPIVQAVKVVPPDMIASSSPFLIVASGTKDMIVQFATPTAATVVSGTVKTTLTASGSVKIVVPSTTLPKVNPTP